jgi:4'-phosphopantetheinyl transferase
MDPMLCANSPASLGDRRGPASDFDHTLVCRKSDAVDRPPRLSRLRFLTAPDSLDPPTGELHVWRLSPSPSALREVLAVYLGEDPARIALEAGEHGKPRLAGPGRLRFNHSHSGEIALVAVSGELEVGVDVEEVRPGRNVVGLAERAFAPAMAAAVREAPAAERDLLFHRRWTAHEARLKCLGVGLSGAAPPAADGPLAVAEVDVSPGYAAALAVAGAAVPPLRGWTFGPPVPGDV